MLIYVASFSPSHNSPLCVGGFEWRYKRQDSLDYLIELMTGPHAEGCNYALVELHIPDELLSDDITAQSNGITTWIDHNLHAVEPAGVA